MNEERGYLSGFLQTAAQMAFFGLIFWVIGYLFILITRLFTRPTKLPTALDGIVVGFACIWTIWMFGGLMSEHDIKNSKPKQHANSPYGYDYELFNDRVRFTYVPKQPDLMHYSGSKNRWKNDLYLIRDTRDKKLFYISSEKDKVVYPQYLKESNEEIQYLVEPIDYKGHCLKRKKIIDRTTWIWTALIALCSILCFLHAQCSAIFGESFDQFEGGKRPENPIPISTKPNPTKENPKGNENLAKLDLILEKLRETRQKLEKRSDANS